MQKTFAFICCLIIIGSSQAVLAGPKSKSDQMAYDYEFHSSFIRQIKECPSLKMNGLFPFYKKGVFPDYEDNDPRLKSWHAAVESGVKEGIEAANRFIKNSGMKLYCKHIFKSYGPASTIAFAVREVSKEEKKGLKYFPLAGCKKITSITFQNWPCDKDPRAEPEICEASKRVQIKNGYCRTDLGLVTDNLKATGKTHKDVWHEEFTGLKNSGPFVEVQDKAGNLWWIEKNDWYYANDKTK